MLYVEAFFYEDQGAWAGGAYRNLVTGAAPKIPWPRYEAPFERLREYLHNFDSHVINLVRLMLGDAKGVEYCRWVPDAGLWAMLDYGQFRVGVKNVLTRQRRFEKGVELCGARRRVRLELAPPFERFTAGSVEVIDIEAQTVTRPLPEYEWPFDREYAHFAECVLRGAEPRTSGRQAAGDVALCEELARVATAG